MTQRGDSPRSEVAARTARLQPAQRGCSQHSEVAARTARLQPAQRGFPAVRGLLSRLVADGACLGGGAGALLVAARERLPWLSEDRASASVLPKGDQRQMLCAFRFCRRPGLSFPSEIESSGSKSTGSKQAHEAGRIPVLAEGIRETRAAAAALRPLVQLVIDGPATHRGLGANRRWLHIRRRCVLLRCTGSTCIAQILLVA